MKSLRVLPPSLRVLCAIVLAPALHAAEQLVPQQFPTSVKLPPNITFEPSGTQIASIRCPAPAVPAVKFPQPLPSAFTVSFSFITTNPETLSQQAADAKAPVTLAHFFSPDNSQQLFFRLIRNKLSVSSTTDKGAKWTDLSPYNAPPVLPISANQTYNVLFIQDATECTLIINNTIEARSPSFPRVSNLTAVTWGRFGAQRPLEGTILSPKILPRTLAYNELTAILSRQTAAQNPKQPAADLLAIPQPFPPNAKLPPNISLSTNNLQIASLRCPTPQLPALRFPQPLPDAFSFAFSFTSTNPTTLSQKETDATVPVTLAHFSSPDTVQQLFFRIYRNKLRVSVTNDKGAKWTELTPWNTPPKTAIKANQPYEIRFTRDATTASLLINNVAEIENAPLPPTPNLTLVTYGHSAGKRPFEGELRNIQLTTNQLPPSTAPVEGQVITAPSEPDKGQVKKSAPTTTASVPAANKGQVNNEPAAASPALETTGAALSAAAPQDTFPASDLPVPQTFPADKPPPPEITLSTDNQQIDAIRQPTATTPGVHLAKALPAEFTLAFSFIINDKTSLIQQAADDRAPVTLAHLTNPGSTNQLFLRLHKGRLIVSATNDGGKKWTDLKTYPNWPFSPSTDITAAIPFTVAFVQSTDKSTVYLNGSFLAVSAAGFPKLSGLNSIVYGHAGNRRILDGCVFAPRIYPKPLSPEEVKTTHARQAAAFPEHDFPAVSFYPGCYDVYPTLKVVANETHEFTEGLDTHAAVLDDPFVPFQKNILVAPTDNFFGNRAAFRRQLPTLANKLPLYDNGITLKNLPYDRVFTTKHPDGSSWLYALGQNTPHGLQNLVRAEITQFPDKPPRFGDPEAVLFGGKPLLSVLKPLPTRWVVADLDNDGVRDLVFACRRHTNATYWPHGESPWGNPKRPGYKKPANIGGGRGYDVTGIWLGDRDTFSFFWAKGALTGGSLSFSAPKPIWSNEIGFLAQLRVWQGTLAFNVLPINKIPTLVVFHEVDRLTAIPASSADGEVVLENPAPLLAGNASIQGTYYDINAISVLKSPGEPAPGQAAADDNFRLLLDGNVGRLVVLEGNAIGNFRELGSLQTAGGPVSTDSLVTPFRVDWDRDGFPDLVTGDASGFLIFWRGTADPFTYHAGIHFTVNEKKFHHQAGPTGSFQGPCEVRWGYLQPGVGPWTAPDSLDIITGDITTGFTLYQRAPGGTPTELTAPKTFTKDGKPWKVAWRVRPVILPAKYNYGGLGRPVLLHLDWDGDLAAAIPDAPGSTVIERVEKLRYEDGSTVRLSSDAGNWGRAKLSVCEWFGDGNWHLVLGTNYSPQRMAFDREGLVGASPFLFENTGGNSTPKFKLPKAIRLKNGTAIDMRVHNASPWPFYQKDDPLPGLIVGAEDGKVYVFPRSELQ